MGIAVADSVEYWHPTRETSVLARCGENRCAVRYLISRGYTLHGNGPHGLLAKRDGAVVYRGRCQRDGVLRWTRFFSRSSVGDLINLVAHEEGLDLRDAIDRVVSLEQRLSHRAGTR